MFISVFISIIRSYCFSVKNEISMYFSNPANGKIDIQITVCFT